MSHLRISHKEALEKMARGLVRMNGEITRGNPVVAATDEVVCNKLVVQKGKTLLYVAFHKPAGIETTLNTDVADNLKALLPFEEKLFPAGRLDKASEGLLLLTNDGYFFEQVIHPSFHTPKHYRVAVDKVINSEFIEKMSTGVLIMGKTTRPCGVWATGEKSFEIILTEGRNRQIRRMCHRLGYSVTQLIRLSIGGVHLDDLQSGQYRFFDPKEVVGM